MLELGPLTNDELYEKLNNLHGKLRYLKYGHSAVDHQHAIAQCEAWAMQLEIEISERLANEVLPESGTVAIIGEPENEEDDKKKT